MIHLALERHLDVAAASGVVEHGGRLYVVADDELDLTVYPVGGGPGTRVPLLAGTLPAERAARKAAKPDLEALALLPGDRLLAVPSGSRPNRCTGALLPIGGAARPVDFAPLYAALAGALPELNIEGAAVSGGRMRLLQRGNGRAARSAIIDLDLAGALAALAGAARLDEGLLRAVTPIALGELGGVPLAFTDASPLPDGRLVFTAAAEAGGDTYLDGPISGAAIGLLAGAAVTWLEPVDPPLKLEGVHATAAPDGRSARLWLVADADDPAVPAPLLWAVIPI